MSFKRFLTLAYFLSYTELKAESKKFFMSYLWWIVEPVLNMIVYYVVFGVLLNRGQPDFIYFLLVGLIAWKWFGATLSQSSMSIVQNRHLIKRIVISKPIFPTVTVLTQTFKFLIVLSVVTIFLWFNGYPLTIHYIALVPLLISQFLLILGLSFLFSALLPFMLDLRLLINAALTMLFFLSGVFFSGSSLSPEIQVYFYLNPLSRMIESYRAILIYQKWPYFPGILNIFILGILFLGCGYYLIKKFNYVYPKVLR